MAQFNDEDRQWLFDQMQQNGIDTGSYDDFKESLNNDEDRQWYYDKSIELGFDVGNKQEFDDMMWERPSKPTGEVLQQSLQQKLNPAANVPAPETSTRPPEQKEERVNAVNGMTYTQAGLDSLDQGYKTQAVDESGDTMTAEQIQDAMLQKMKEHEPDAWRNESMEVDMDNSGKYAPTSKGQVYDELYKVFGQAVAEAPTSGASAYAQARARAEQMGIGDNDTLVSLLGRVNKQYARDEAQKAVKAIVSKLPERTADPMEAVKAVYYDPEIQKQLHAVANAMGNDYADVVNMFVKPQLREALKMKYGGDDNYWSGVRGLFSDWNTVNDLWESQHVNEVLGNYFAPSINEALEGGEARKQAILGNALEDDANTPEAMKLQRLFNAFREGNKAADPDTMLQALKDNMGGVATEILQDPQTFEDIWNRAEQKKMDVNDYIEKYVAPELQNALVRRFEQEAVKRNLPKDQVEYILRGLTEDNVIAMIANSMLRTDAQNRYMAMADQMTEAGQNPNVNPGLLAEGLRLASGMAADFWLWGGWGKIGGKATQALLSRRLATVAAERGLTEAAAREVLMQEAKASLKGRTLQQVLQHIPQSVITGTGASTTSSIVRGIRDDESAGEIISNAIRELPGHVMTFGAFGGMSGLTGSITNNWKGWKKLLGKAMGYEGSALTLYGTGEAAKAMNGEDAFENVPKGLLKAHIDQLAMHFASNPGKAVADLYKAMRHPVKWSQTSDAELQKGVLTEEDIADLTGSEDGMQLSEALEQMKPRVSTEAMKDITSPGAYGTEETAKRLADWLNNKDRPLDRKRRVGSLLGFVVPWTPETSSDIVNDGGNGVILRTRDQNGNCVRELHFDTQAEAEQFQHVHQSAFQLNDMRELWNGTTKSRRMAAVMAMMGETGLEEPGDIQAIFDGKADAEVTNAMYDALQAVAVRSDEPNAPRFYEQGRNISIEDRHAASLKEQRALNLIESQGTDFATDVLAGRDTPEKSLPQIYEKYGPVKAKMTTIYYNNYALTKGMMDEINSNIDRQVNDANRIVSEYSHPSGNVVAVDINGHRYYLTDHDVTVNSDGSINAGGRDTVIVRNGETGKVEMVEPRIVKVTGMWPTEELMRQNEEQLRGDLTKEATDTVEYAPGTPEQPIAEDFYTGADGQRYMTMQVTDDLGRPTWLKVPVDEQGQPIGQPMPLDRDEYRQAKSNEIDAQEHPDMLQTAENMQEDAEVPGEKIPLTDEIPESAEKQGAVLDNAGGENVNEETVDKNPPASATSRIPVDENGKMQYEQAASEDTLAYLNEKYGEEKAQKMIATIANNAAKELESLQNADTSGFTDMADLDAHEEKVLAAEQKVKYWQELMKPEEKAVAEEQKPAEEELPAQKPTISGPQNEDFQPANQQKPASPSKPAKPETPVTPPAEPAKPAEPAQPAGPTAEKKIAQGTVKNNIGKRFGFQNQDGTRSEVTIDAFKGDDLVTVTRQDYDKNGLAKGEPYQTDFKLTDVSNSIINGLMKPALTTDEKLRKVFKYTVGNIPLADVLTEKEKLQLLDLYAKGDMEAIGNMTADLMHDHHEDLILRGRDIRNAKVDQIMNSNASREQKLRKVRDLYKGYADAEVMLEDETLTPGTIEEYVADLHSRVPKRGEGPIAYFSYEKDGTPITGLQDETGYGKKNSGDADAFKPWLAPQGKGVSLMKYAEQIHSQLPEPIQEQFDVNEVRNAILNVFGGAERPSDITTMVIKRGIIQAEQAARRQEEMWIDGGPSLHKVSADDNSFTGRLTRAKQQTNTEPTDGQKDAGNYKKGHVSFGGYDFVVENPEGSMRRGEANGKKWEQKINNTYGYILGRYGKDGDHLDMFINDNADLDNWNGKVYVIDQVDPKTGAFDEHKVMYGFDSEAEARNAYLSNYEKGWKGLGKITGVSKDKFDEWLDSSKRKFKPFAEHSIGREAAVEEVRERIGEMEAVNNAEAEKQTKPATPDQRDKVLMNTYIEHMADGKMKAKISTDIEEAQRILDDYYKSKAAGESVDDDEVKAQKVSDKAELERLEKEPTVKRYRAMQLIDGKLYPPMSAKVNGEMREPTEIGVWEKAEERPDLVKNGKFVLNKGQKGQSNVPAAYNPYFHTSTSGLNDQFTSAYKRPELVVVEVEIPESELTSGYKAEGAKDAVGNVDWHSGVVNGQLPADRQRQVTLSRYSKVNRIVPDSEVADMIAKQLEGTNIEVPYNVVTPAQRAELEKRGVKISDKPAGTVTEDINGNPIKDSKPSYFKTPDGRVYGFTYQGKIYVDPRIATSETPVHEYGHLWVQMKRQSAPEEWENIKKVFLNDKLVQPIIDRVKQEYPELAKEGREDDFVEELVTQFSGKRGAERMRDMAQQIAEERGGVFGKAEAVAAMQRMKTLLSEFWASIAKMMGWKYRNANDIADKMMLDFLDGMNPSEEIKKARTNRAEHLKQRQLDIILKENPADDENMPGHTWIRSIEDVKTFNEALEYDGYSADEDVTPDFTSDMVKDALKNGVITVYSSKPIVDGAFVTPSKMEAKNYAGNGKVYSKEVPLTDVAWIDATQGQYANVSEQLNRQKVNYASDEEKQRTETIFNAAKKLFGTTNDVREAGYVLPDGSMPDFSGRHQMNPGSDTSFLRGRRSTDHREIESIAYERDGNTKTGIETDMPDFIRRGAIRIDDNAGFINLSVKPTDKQKRILRQLISRNDGYVQVEFGDGWDSDHYVEYDAAKPAKVLADIDRYFDEGIKPDNGPKFQMMGKKGAAEADKLENNAKRMESLKLAEEAEEGGYDAKAIKFATGWERGADGKWRYEIPDADVDIVNAYKQARLDHDKEVARLSKEEDGLLEKYQHLTNIIPGRIDSRYSEEQKAKYREMRKQREKLWKQYLKAGEKVKEYDEQGVSMSLGELMGEDNEVFKYYPELKDVKVSFTSMQGGTAGSFGEDGIKIGYNELKRFDNDELNNENVYATLLHEVQHAIQDIEGFASGGNLYTSTTEEGISAIVEKKQRKAADIKQRLDANRKILSSPEELKAAAELDGKSEKEVKEQLMETIDQQAAEYDTLNNQIEYIKNTKAPAKSDAVDLYRRLSGEVESRNVESRMKLTDQERMATLASETEDVPRDEQVIINGSSGESASMGDSPETFDERQKRAVDNNGIVMPGLKDKSVEVTEVPKHQYTGSWEQARKAAIKDAKEKYTRLEKDDKGKEKRVPIPQQYDNFGQSFKYTISGESIAESVNKNQVDKSLRQNASRGVHLSVLNHLDEVINNSIEIEEHPDYNKRDNDERSPKNGFNPSVLMHRFIGVINVDGTPYSVMTLMKEFKQKELQPKEYAYDVEKIEVLDDMPNTSNGVGKAISGPYPLANLLKDIVKSYEKDKNLLEESEKLTNLSKNGQESASQEEESDIRFQKAPVFISNALKATEDIKQEKATPEQWLAMLQKNGGLKAGEDKWLGLSDWLKQQKGSVTKQDLLDYIRKNQIQVEEVPYQEYFDVDNLPKMQEFRKEYDELVSKYDAEKAVAEEEANAFNDEMFNKYGEGWANDPDRLSEEDQRRNDEMVERWNKLNEQDSAELAFEDMVDRYGDDFSMAFEVNYGNGKLEPQMDMYGDEISDAAKHFLEFDVQPINSTRLGYTTNGLENKREIALTVPTIEPWNEGDQIHFGDADNGRAVAWVRFGDAYAPNMGGDPNSLSDGVSKVLVIDEIQSKRHQEGRDKGYKVDPPANAPEKIAYDNANEEYHNYSSELRKKYGRDDISYGLTEEEKSKLDELFNKSFQARIDYSKYLQAHGYGAFSRSDIPDAPFDKNWHELAMKRMLRYAAENGYDKIAWTTGDQQAERYDLSQLINNISVSQAHDNITGEIVPNEYEIFAKDKNGSVITEVSGRMSGERVKELYGKDLGNRITETADSHGGKIKVLEGVDLRIGGEGMKGFYDEILPRFMNKYGKKWGVKVGEVELPDLEKSAQKMWSIDVTPEMKESVMQGQPMFQRASQPESELTPENEQYWKQWEAAMKKWKERNNIPADAEGVGEKPVFRQGEDLMDFAGKMSKWITERNLWQTAPKLEDYRQARNDKADADEAHAYEKQYPDSEHARRWRVATDLARIRHAMSRQKTYDKATVKAVTDFANDFMKQGFGDELTRGDIERILSSVKNATGAKDVKKYIDNIMNILTKNYRKLLKGEMQRLASVKALKETAQGVETQGKLELKGQAMLKEFKNQMGAELASGSDDITRTHEEVEGKIAALRSRLSEIAEHSSDDSSLWKQEYDGCKLALQYFENIAKSQANMTQLQKDLKEAIETSKSSGRTDNEQRQYLESIKKEMLDNEMERIGMYHDIISQLQGNISESMQGAKEFVERDKQRIKHIYDIANFDLAGKPADTLREKRKGKAAKLFYSPLGTFEQMMKEFGSRNANGEGYLYDHFVRGWMDANEDAYTRQMQSHEELDAKARELFGEGGVERWSDLYDLIRLLPTMEVEMLDGEERKTFNLDQGKLLYIYMADKMNDGRMKLRKMGIDEEKVQKIKDFIAPKLIQLADWLQDEFLPKKRKEYNEVHERMFGAPMAAIDHYFPIKINSDARYQEADMTSAFEQNVLPSTITGSIIKRRTNTLPLDILHTDALSLALEHVDDMDRWAATAEWNKDMSTLLSYTTFRNKVKNMKTIYGSGDELWKAMFNAATIAAGEYTPVRGEADKAISNIAKGVTSAKINFRLYTAFKQILSAPAFLHDVDLKYFTKNSLNPYGSWKWAMENMPVFEKRWKSRQVGDTRLMDDPDDWKIWKNDIVQGATRLGMSANALVDGITCAVGAKSIYDSRLKHYKKIGMSEENAKKRALQDAKIGYNLTQQSSEGAFTSQIQKDRTVVANMLSVFRNGPMSYGRQMYDAYRNLKHRMQPGYKEDSIKFMTRQYQDELGLDEAQAKEAAERTYNNAGWHNFGKLVNMSFVTPVFWNLGASLPYLLVGDDDQTKDEMLKDAVLKGLAGPVEGMAGGNIISDMVSLGTNETVRKAFDKNFDEGLKQARKNIGTYEINPLPLLADLDKLIGKSGRDGYEFCNELFNIWAQSAVGVNPQTFTDFWNACVDYGIAGKVPVLNNSIDKDVYNEELGKSKEIALFIMRVMNAPTSSWRNKYIDELGMDAEDAQKLPYEEMAKRYAHYKHWKDAPFMGFFRSADERNARMEKLQEQFDKAVKERMERLTDEELATNLQRTQSAEERRALANTIAKRLYGTTSIDGKKPTEEWQKSYQSLMDYNDIKEDEQLSMMKKQVTDKDAKKKIEKLTDWMRDGRKVDGIIVAKGKKQLYTGNNQEVMDNIRKWRKEALEIAEQSLSK